MALVALTLVLGAQLAFLAGRVPKQVVEQAEAQGEEADVDQ
jgi:hypothetical protein